MSYGNYAPFYRGDYFNPVMAPGQIRSMPENVNQFAPMYGQPSQPSAPISNDMIWVQGESGAKAYLVAPNTTVTLWDSENPTIYVKSADASGMPTMRVLDFVERNSAPLKKEKESDCHCKGKLEVIQQKLEDFEKDIEFLKSEYKNYSKNKNPKNKEENE